MTKLDKLKQAAHLYVYEKLPLDVIGTKLDLSRRTLFYWKKEYEWDRKRFEFEHTKYRFSKELLELARKMMNKISADIDNNQKTPPLEIYSLINILKNIPLVKQYPDSLQPEQTQKQSPTGFLSPNIIRQIEKEILGIASSF